MKVAVLGYGVVGSGVVEVLFNNADSIACKVGEKIEEKYIVDIRDFPNDPHTDLFTKDFEQVVGDSEVDVVIEVIGGINPAYTFVKRALLAGKSVATSNKELVATHGQELLELARENNVNFMFEASVGGGIPIIRPMHQCLAANNICRVYGILNGTTNYILSKMITDGVEFGDALKNAQKLGYAEANPAADIDGIDACRKISILGSLACGCHINPDSVHTEGIRDLDLVDVKYAGKAGYAIKLLGVYQNPRDGKAYCLVAPFLLKKDSNLAGVQDVFNGIVVEGDMVGETMFYGRGAGKLPTASAVVADVIDCCKHRPSRKYLYWAPEKEDMVVDYATKESVFYVRFKSADAAMIENNFDVDFVISKENGEYVAVLAPICEAEFDEKISSVCNDGCQLLAKYRVFI